MINQAEFERLINLPESSILDFKSKMYDFFDDKDSSKTAKFVKDIISFSNTIRNDNSFIIIGIEEKPDGTKKFHGLDKNIDDSLLQDKVKDKVYPRPYFIYYSIDFGSKKYGIIEFPIIKYSIPVAPSQKLKGLEVGHVYYRQGTTNAEATGIEVIRINDWFKSLPDNQNQNTFYDDVSSLLLKATLKTNKLSVILSEILNLAKKNNLMELIEFCTSEIKGYETKKLEKDSDDYKYRTQKVFISSEEIEINPHSVFKVTADMIKNEMKNNKKFFELNLRFSNPILEIEDYIDKFKIKNGSFATFKMSTKYIFTQEDKTDYTVNVYLFEETFINLYRSIRQRIIDKLTEL